MSLFIQLEFWAAAMPEAHWECKGQSFLDELSGITGGKSFYPNTNVEMDEIFERIALELRHQYSVGYTPKDFEPNGKWRKVKVKVKPPRGLPRLIVRSREGYFATPSIAAKIV